MNRWILKLLLGLLAFPLAGSAWEIPGWDSLRFYLAPRVTHGRGLDEAPQKRRRENEQRVRLGLRYSPMLGEYLRFDSDMRLVFVNRLLDNRENRHHNPDVYFEVRQLYLETPYLWSDQIPLGGMIGRKIFRDARGWWYDNQLDSARLQYHTTLLTSELSVGGRIIDERVASVSDPNTGLEKSLFVIAHTDYHYLYRHHLEGFAIFEHLDGDTHPIGHQFSLEQSARPKADLVWLGLRTSGDLQPAKSHLHYWLDLATVFGDSQDLTLKRQPSGDRKVVGFNNINLAGGLGLDIGFLWKPATEHWGFGLDYARGSGDGRGSSTQHRFVQSEIVNNKGYHLGTTRYRIYGELLRPELSNLQIFSAFGGWQIIDRLWLEAAFHSYHQVNADNSLISSRLVVTPNGRHKHIGEELDLILGKRWGNGAKLQLIGSGFRRGEAFDGVSDTRYAYRIVLEMRVYW